jgi:hypothetical protein
MMQIPWGLNTIANAQPKSAISYHTISALIGKPAMTNNNPKRKIPEIQVDKIETKTLSYHNIFTRTVLGATQTFIKT